MQNNHSYKQLHLVSASVAVNFRDALISSIVFAQYSN